MKRGYYRIPRKFPTNRVDGALAEVVRTKFAEGWPKARIARELRLARRTVIRICAPLDQPSISPPQQPELPTPGQQAGPAQLVVRDSNSRKHLANADFRPLRTVPATMARSAE